MPVWSEAGCRARAGGLPSGGGSERGRTACGLVAPAGLALATGWPARARSVLRSRVERSAGSARVSCPVPALCARVGAYWPFARVGARWPFACVCSAGHSRAGRRLPTLRARRRLLALRPLAQCACLPCARVGAWWTLRAGRCQRVSRPCVGVRWGSARARGFMCDWRVRPPGRECARSSNLQIYTQYYIWVLDFLCNT